MKAKAGFTGLIGKQDLAVIRAELKRIRLENSGLLKPKFVVESAVSARSPLHQYFDWNDKTAAKKHRLHQARELIRLVKIRVVTAKWTRDLPEYVSVRQIAPTNGNGKRQQYTYIPLAEAVSDDYFKKQIVERALDQAELWRDRYRTLSELEPIHFAIGETSRKLRKASLRKS